MFSNKYFSISDFARLMGVSRQTLLYYDRIGLFKPVKVLDNGYRAYSRSQINIFSMIYMLGEMRVPLKEIRQIVEQISPDTAMAVLEKQRGEMEKTMQKLKLLEGMMALRIAQISEGKAVLEKQSAEVSLEMLPEDIPLYLGKEINGSWEEITDDMIVDFYESCETRGLPMIFSGGQMKRREELLRGDTEQISHLCCRLREPRGANAVIPQGCYAVSYVRGDYGNVGGVYSRILSFIKERHMQIVGNAYEEYLLDELTGNNPAQFVMKIMVQVDTVIPQEVPNSSAGKGTAL